MLIGIDRDAGQSGFSRTQSDRRNLSGEMSGLLRGLGLALALERKLIRLFARDPVLPREHFRGLAHDQTRQRIRKTIAIHRIDKLEVAHLVAPARVRGVDQIRDAAHVLDTAGEHDVGFAEADARCTGREGLHAAGAGFVDRVRGR